MTESQKAQTIAILEAIVSLENSESWKHFALAAEDLARSNMPDISMVHDADHALQVASQVAFASGIRRAVGIIRSSKEKLKSLQGL